MSTLRADTIQSTGGGAATLTKQQAAKAWSKQTTGTLNGSFNSSGVTDNATGDFTINFSNSMSDANYSSTLGSADGNSNDSVILCVNNSAGYATGSINYFIVTDDGGAVDAGPMACTIQGDLA
jgi:hypothetical protein